MKMTVRDWLKQGGHFTSALLACYESPTDANIREVCVRYDLANKRRFERVVKQAREWVRTGGESFDTEMPVVMRIEWPLLCDLDREVTREEFSACFRN